MRRLFPVIAIALLAGCKPGMSATGIAGRTITITNTSRGDVRVDRIVANDQAGREECEASVGATLAPGRTHTVTFFNCGRVERVSVVSDSGTIALDVEDDSVAIGNGAG